MIGLLGADPFWQELLRQEGVCFQRHAADQFDGLAVLILDQAPSKSEAAQVKRFMDCGGSILAGVPSAVKVWPELKFRNRHLKYVVPDRSALFRNTAVIDLETDGSVLQEANCGFTPQGAGAVYAGRLGQGWAVLLPFELSAVLAQHRSRPRSFYARTHKPLYETVARVNRGEVRRLAANGLRFLLAQTDRPYVRLSFVPGSHSSIFGFRVDTDFDPVGSIQAVAGIAAEAGMRFSWYLNVEALGQNLNRTIQTLLKGHDIQLHCFHHTVYPDYERNFTNLQKGCELMREAGANPLGTVSPYGEWNREWNQAVTKLGLSYSSEFSLAYDDLPFRPVLNGDKGKVLQVPIHPISFGRLAAARSAPEEMVRYFKRHIDLQARRSEPCFLYGHPGKLTRFANELQAVLGYGVARCGAWTTVTDYARWWMKREKARFGLSQKSGLFMVEVETGAEDVELVLERKDSCARVPFRSQEIELGRLDWQPLPPAARFDPRELAARSRTWVVYFRETLRQLRKRMLAGRR